MSAEARNMKLLTVKQVAKISGVSVRALHHYDEIGLLKPASIGRNNYRYYGRDELLRLQQNLLPRELDTPRG
jgi:DNA-binding transcriptional MerR regulator